MALARGCRRSQATAAQVSKQRQTPGLLRCGNSDTRISRKTPPLGEIHNSSGVLHRPVEPARLLGYWGTGTRRLDSSSRRVSWRMRLPFRATLPVSFEINWRSALGGEDVATDSSGFPIVHALSRRSFSSRGSGQGGASLKSRYRRHAQSGAHA